tara:strand:- start:180 stop:941 length:762 start_codon:yes stop_codon:yes gene_type:complete
MSIERKELAEELLLREYIRKAIKVVKKKRQKIKERQNEEEGQFRKIIRNMIIKEAKKVPKWESYGKNNLDVMLMKTNFLDSLETGYKSLTTTVEQRNSYKNHIMQNVKKTLNLEKAKEIQGDQSINLTEDEDDVNMTIDGGELMGLKPEDERVKEEDGQLEDFKVEGDDYSGLREAYEAFNLIEDTLLKFWKKMDLEEDKDIFYDNLIEQVNLYFDKWEGELDITPESAPDMEQPAEEPTIELEPEEETDIEL